MYIDSLYRNLLKMREQAKNFAAYGNEVPLMNIVENNGEYKVRVLLPGVTREDVDITYADGLLTLEGEKKETKAEGYELIRSELNSGKFSRSIRLSDKIAPSSIKAKYVDGVLELTMNTVPEAAPKKIKIS